MLGHGKNQKMLKKNLFLKIFYKRKEIIDIMHLISIKSLLIQIELIKTNSKDGVKYLINIYPSLTFINNIPYYKIIIFYNF